MSKDINNFWITSDLHLCHDNLCLGSSKWSDKRKCRPFYDAAEMNEVLISNINRMVPTDGFLIHCGDFVVGAKDKIEAIKYLRPKINCKNIIFVKGNHDSSFKKFEEVKQLFYNETMYVIFEKGFKSTYIVCSHFRQGRWNHDDEEDVISINVYGHSHGHDIDTGLRQWDVAPECNNFEPYYLPNLVESLKSRPIQRGHHASES